MYRDLTCRSVLILLFAAIVCSQAFAEESTTKPSAKNPPFGVKVTGTGPPMILIPGLTCSGAVWDQTVDPERVGVTIRTCYTCAKLYSVK